MMAYPGDLNNLLRTIGSPTRTCFISYHHADEWEVRQFVTDFEHSTGTFTSRALGVELDDDIVDSTDTDYVMRAIRERYMAGTSVTLVMIGRCTWSRRYVDWEIQASLRNALGSPANGLLGIKLPSYPATSPFPERLNLNLLPPSAAPWEQRYARWMDYPRNSYLLKSAIEEAYGRRSTHGHLINNPRAAYTYNRDCV